MSHEHGHGGGGGTRAGEVQRLMGEFVLTLPVIGWLMSILMNGGGGKKKGGGGHH